MGVLKRVACVISEPIPSPLPKGKGEPPIERFAFKKLVPVDLAFETPKNGAKGILLSSGEGLGVRPVSQKQNTSPGTPGTHKKPRLSRT